ncbi:L,D-transpeptidase [Marinitoga hydrogenitolerans]|nr:L,D-transpeptidase [Marinitoga hydrogenitolerans]
MDNYNYEKINSFGLKRKIGAFEIYEPFFRDIKLNDFGNDIWRLKFLFSKLLYFSGKGSKFKIDQVADENFFKSINEFKKDWNIDEGNIGIKTIKKILDLTNENFIFLIEVILPDNRAKLGTLKLYNMESKLLYSCGARGHGQHDIETSISQKMVNGDTPIGIYLSSYESGILKNDPEKFGYNGVFRLWYPLYGYATNIYKINRDGILIHGGTEKKELRKTHGCIVIHNNDQKNIQKIMIEKIKHPYLMPTYYIEFYTGIVMVKRTTSEKD